MENDNYDLVIMELGTDEIVALTNIVKYLDEGYKAPDGRLIKFDRIVIDTVRNIYHMNGTFLLICYNNVCQFFSGLTYVYLAAGYLFILKIAT